jgi:hypothetical protein
MIDAAGGFGLNGRDVKRSVALIYAGERSRTNE